MEDGSIAMMNGFQVGEKTFAIPLASEDGLSLVSTRGHMVKGIGELDPQGSRQVDLSKTFVPFLITQFNLCQELRPDPMLLLYWSHGLTPSPSIHFRVFRVLQPVLGTSFNQFLVMDYKEIFGIILLGSLCKIE